MAMIHLKNNLFYNRRCSYVQPPQKIFSLEDTVKLVDEVTKDLSQGCYSSIQPSILRLSSNLKQHGPSLELQHTSHLDRLQLVLRPACRDQKLDLVSRVLLLEMIELRTFNWAPSQHVYNYYKIKLQQINSEMLAGDHHSQSAQDYSSRHDFQSAPGPLRHSNVNVKAPGFRPGTSHHLMNIPNRPASSNHLIYIPNRPPVPNRFNIPNRPAVPNYPMNISNRPAPSKPVEQTIKVHTKGGDLALTSVSTDLLHTMKQILQEELSDEIVAKSGSSSTSSLGSSKPELVYERPELVSLASSPVCRNPPKDWDNILIEIPDIVKSSLIMEMIKDCNQGHSYDATEGIDQKEQGMVIDKLKKVLNFLESVQIKNKESLVNINKPIEDLLASMKYLPIESSYDILPIEIKTKILSYLCDSGAFVAASVCHEWKDILKGRLDRMDEVNIGKCCSNEWGCEDFACFMPEETMKASMILKLDIPLSICYPVGHVESKLIAESLTSVSDFSITNKCYCREDDDDFDADMPVLNRKQIKSLIEALEEKTDTVDNVHLEGLNMTHLDQDRLINCLLKIKNLRLVQGRFPYDDTDDEHEPMLHVETLIEKLLQDSKDTKLKHLNLEYMEYPEELSLDLADALCKVESVHLGQYFPLALATTNRLLQNIINESIKTKTLFIMKNLHWRNLISSENLKTVINKMDVVQLCGNFSAEQVEAARSIDGVGAVEYSYEKNVFTLVKISKGCAD